MMLRTRIAASGMLKKFISSRRVEWVGGDPSIRSHFATDSPREDQRDVRNDNASPEAKWSSPSIPWSMLYCIRTSYSHDVTKSNLPSFSMVETRAMKAVKRI